MLIDFKLSREDARVLLLWYDNLQDKAGRFGGARFVFPQEEMLVRRLEQIDEESHFDELDLDIFYDWMERNLAPRPGNTVYYFPHEEELARRLMEQQKRRARIKSNIDPAQREKARHLADRLIDERKNGDKG